MNFPSSVRLKPFRCPICQYEMDASALVGSDEPVVPKEGDLSVCAMCLSIGIFQDDGTLRIATSEECERLPMSVRVCIARMTH